MEDYRIPKLEVFAVNEAFVRLTGSIPYDTLVWHRRYHECGEFTMTLRASVYDPSWAYIYCDERPETAIIEKVVYADTALSPDGDDTVTISGRFFECLLNRRTFLVEKTATKVITETRTMAPLRYSTQGKGLYLDTKQGGYYQKDGEGNIQGQDEHHSEPSKTKDEKTGEVTEGTKWKKLSVPEDAKTAKDGTITFSTTDKVKYKEEKTYKTGKKKGQTVEVTKTKDVEVKHELVAQEYTIDRGAYYYWGDDSVGGDLMKAYIDSSGNVTRERIETDKLLFDPTGKMDSSKWEGSSTQMYYKDADGNIKLATGIVRSREQSYVYKPKTYTIEREVKVKGPWQLTEVDDPERSMDSVQHLMQWARMLFQNEFIWEEPEISGEVKVIDPSLTLMGDLLYSELETIGATFSVLYDFENDKLAFRIWRGKDRTQSQSGNPWAVFSDEWGNIYGWAASRDKSAYCNKCYVLYDYEAPTRWDGSGRPYLEPRYEVNDDGESVTLKGWNIPYERKAGYLVYRIEDGLPDCECVLDRRGEAPSYDKDWQRSEYKYDSGKANSGRPSLPSCRSAYDQFWNGIRPSGKKELENGHAVLTTLDAGSLNATSYLTGYDIGDVVDMSVAAVGLVEEARITGIVETHQASGSTIELEIGEPISIKA